MFIQYNMLNTNKTKNHRKNIINSKTTKKQNNKNYLILDINFNSKDRGYHILKSDKVKQFLLSNVKKGNNLIQTIPDTYFYLYKKTTLSLRAIPYYHWIKPNLKWNDIYCDIKDKNIKGTPCQLHNTHKKIFYKLKSNTKIAGFGIYLYHLIHNKITLKQHINFINHLKKIMNKDKVYIHNQEVDWFHIKSFTDLKE